MSIRQRQYIITQHCIGYGTYTTTHALDVLQWLIRHHISPDTSNIIVTLHDTLSSYTDESDIYQNQAYISRCMRAWVNTASGDSFSSQLMTTLAGIALLFHRFTPSFNGLNSLTVRDSILSNVSAAMSLLNIPDTYFNTLRGLMAATMIVTKPQTQDEKIVHDIVMLPLATQSNAMLIEPRLRREWEHISQSQYERTRRKLIRIMYKTPFYSNHISYDMVLRVRMALQTCMFYNNPTVIYVTDFSDPSLDSNVLQNIATTSPINVWTQCSINDVRNIPRLFLQASHGRRNITLTTSMTDIDEMSLKILQDIDVLIAPNAIGMGILNRQTETGDIPVMYIRAEELA